MTLSLTSLARAKASRRSASSRIPVVTPLPWWPSCGLTTTGVAEPLRVLDGRLHPAHDRTFGHRDAGVVEHVLGELLVAGGLDPDHAGARGDGGPDAALVLALPELHQVVVVEAEHGDAAVLRLDDYTLVQLGEGKYQRRIEASI